MVLVALEGFSALHICNLKSLPPGVCSIKVTPEKGENLRIASPLQPRGGPFPSGLTILFRRAPSHKLGAPPPFGRSKRPACRHGQPQIAWYSPPGRDPLFFSSPFFSLISSKCPHITNPGMNRFHQEICRATVFSQTKHAIMLHLKRSRILFFNTESLASLRTVCGNDSMVAKLLSGTPPPLLVKESSEQFEPLSGPSPFTVHDGVMVLFNAQLAFFTPPSLQPFGIFNSALHEVLPALENQSAPTNAHYDSRPSTCGSRLHGPHFSHASFL